MNQSILKALVIFLAAFLMLVVSFKLIDLAIGILISLFKFLLPMAVVTILVLWIVHRKKRKVF